jgi:GNAT superfamily N-acetyltransferase
MGYNFTPKEDHTAALHTATDKLEDLLEEFIKGVKGYSGIQLIVRAPNWNEKSRHGSNPLDTDWYDDYPTFVKDCELRLLVTIKGGMLRNSRTEVYAKCRLTKLPACCGVCVMNGIELHSAVRGNGIGKAFTQLVEAFAKVLNYSYIMCTTHKVNGPAIGVLECLGYVELDSGFANMRTKNSIRMFGKNINPDGTTLTDGYLDLKD